MSSKNIVLSLALLLFFPIHIYAQWASKSTLSISGLKNGILLNEDFNGDSKTDLVVSGFDGQQNLNRVYFNTQNKLTSNNYISIPVSDTVIQVQAFSYNQDGLQDLLITTKRNNQSYLSVYQNNSIGFEKVNSIVNAFQDDSLKVAILDYNQDLYPDLLIATNSNSSSKLFLLENNKGQDFFEHVLQVPSNVNFVFSTENNTVLWANQLYTITSNGTLKAISNALNSIKGKTHLQDINNDNELDIYINGMYNNLPFHGFLSNAGGVFSVSNFNLPKLSHTNIIFQDKNEDALPDLLIFGNVDADSSGLFYFQNTGSTFSSPKNICSLASQAFSLADISGDGSMELYTTGISVNEYSFLQFSDAKSINTINFPAQVSVVNTVNDTTTFTWQNAQSTIQNDHLFYELEITSNSGFKHSFGPLNYSNTQKTNFNTAQFNLATGDYTFKIRAFNGTGLVSNSLTGSFSVLKQFSSTDFFRVALFHQDEQNYFLPVSKTVGVDSDSKIDFISQNSNNTISIFKNLSDTYFSKEKTFVGSDLKISNLRTANLNGLYINANGELNRFSPIDNKNTSTGIKNVSRYVVLDIDNDGDEDVFIDSKSASQAELYLNVEGEFEKSKVNFSKSYFPWVSFDFNNDGFVDILCNERLNNTNKFEIGWNSQNGITWDTIDLSHITSPIDLLDIVDYEQDQDWDILCKESFGRELFFIQNVNNNFKTQINFSEEYINFTGWSKSNNHLLKLMNVDDDKTMEVIFFDFKKIAVYDSNNVGNYKLKFEQIVDIPYTATSKVVYSAVSDINNDGKMDLFVQYELSTDVFKSVIFYGLIQKSNIVSSPLQNTKSTVTNASVKLSWDKDPTNATRFYKIDLYSKSDTLVSSGIKNNTYNITNDLGSIFNSEITFDNLLSGLYYWKVYAIKEGGEIASSSLNSFKIESFVPIEIKTLPDNSSSPNFGGSLFSRPCDLDNDGNLDFLFLGIRRDTTPSSPVFISNNHVYLNQGDNTFQTKLCGIDSLFTADVDFFDYNKDGFQDVVVCAAGMLLANTHWETGVAKFGTHADFFTKIYLNNHDGTFRNSGVELPHIGLGKIDVQDYNNDGLEDLLISGRDSIKVSPEDKGEGLRNWYVILATNNGHGFDFDTLYHAYRNVYGVFQDTDKDGDEDIFILGGDYTNKNSVNIQLVNNNNKFENHETFVKGYAISFVDFADYDRDGDADMLVLGTHVNNYNYYSTRNFNESKNVIWDITVYKNLGNNNYIPSGEIIQATIPTTRIHQIHWLDINNDGNLDIVIQQDNEIYMIQQKSNGDFKAVESLHIQDNFTFSTYGDFNNDSKIDFVTGGRMNPFILHLNNIENVNKAPQSAQNFKTTIIDNQCVLKWNNNGDDLTPSSSLRYGIVLSHADSTLIYSNINPKSQFSDDYKNTLLKNEVSFKNLKDGHYNWRVNVIDDNFNASPLSLSESFEIRHDPKITGLGDTCENLIIQYTVEPQNQRYQWVVDTAAAFVIDSLSGPTIRIKWKKSGDSKLVVQNLDYAKSDTLKIHIRENKIPYFSARIANDSLKTQLVFEDSTTQQIKHWSWLFVEQNETMESEKAIYDFKIPNNYKVKLSTVYENNCQNFYEKTIQVKSPKIFGVAKPCKGKTETYEVLPAEYNYSWNVIGGEKISTDKNKITIKWTSTNTAILWVQNTQLLQNGILTDTLHLVFEDTATTNFVVPEKIGVNAAVEFKNLSSTDASFAWYVNNLKTSQDRDFNYTFTQAGNYIIKLETKTEKNCFSSKTAEVNISNALELKIVNVITPNNDGVNDNLFIENLERYPNNEVKLVSLMGKIVFETTNYKNDFNLSQQTKSLAEDTYICTVKVAGFDTEIVQLISVIKN